MSTAELAAHSGISDSRFVWGLLKMPRQDGQVLRERALWVLNPDYLPPYVKRAIEVLRDKGWRLQPPGFAMPREKYGVEPNVRANLDPTVGTQDE